MENFNDADFDIPQTDPREERDKQIKLLRNEIQFLKSELNMGAKMQGLVGGSAIGYALGMGGLGIGLGAILGYNLAQNKSITPELRQKIIIAIKQKKGQLDRLENLENVKRAEGTGIMSSSDMTHYEYEDLPFTGKWSQFIGRPSKNFHALIFGRPKMGKSYFAISFAKYLSNFGRVMYIASEEGFSATLKKKIDDFGLANSNVDFANFRDFIQIKNSLRNNPYDFVFIDSINFINLEPHDVEELKDLNPDTAFVTIQQATKQGYARGSQEFAHNSDIIIEVVNGVAYATGRFAPPSEMQIFDTPQRESNSHGKTDSNSYDSLSNNDLGGDSQLSLDDFFS
jgi:hypothetical protein